MILRLYGHARLFHPRDAIWGELLEQFPPKVGARQIIDFNVDLVQTSCGMSVPFLEYKGEREQLNQWAEKKGKDGIEQYWQQKNLTSIDGKPTNILPGKAP